MILLFHPEAKDDIKAIAENYAAVSIGIKRYEKKLERSKSLKKVCENLMEKLQVDSAARPPVFLGFQKS